MITGKRSSNGGVLIEIRDDDFGSRRVLNSMTTRIFIRLVRRRDFCQHFFVHSERCVRRGWRDLRCMEFQ